MIVCGVCGKKVAVENIDEFTPHDETNGINLPIGEFSEDEMHIFRGGRGNTLMIHYSDVEKKNAEEVER